MRRRRRIDEGQRRRAVLDYASVVLNVPNTITLLRIALVPVILVQIQQHDYAQAIVLFLVSALSDAADGMIARRWNLLTRFGAIADPVADKLTMLSATVLLTLQQWIPWPFTAAVIVRDGLIIGGALAYHFMIGTVGMAPSRISKLNTALEYIFLLAVMAVGAGAAADGDWRRLLMLATFVTVVLSGGHYVLVWSRKAIAARRA